MLSSQQALPGIGRVRILEDLKTKRKIRRQAAREVRIDLRAAPAVDVAKHRPVADETITVRRSAKSVVGLSESPDIVIADAYRVVGIAGADSHLVVERPALVVPHLLQPIQAKPCFVGEIRRSRACSHL